MLDDLLDKNEAGQPFFGDTAYSGKNCDALIQAAHMENSTHEKGYRYKKLTRKQIKQNTLKLKTRARIEHVFGYQWKNLSAGQLIRNIGIVALWLLDYETSSTIFSEPFSSFNPGN